jgi:epoxide hydrolase 4
MVSQIGDGVSKLALLWFVYAITGSALKTSVIGMLQTVPPIVFGPLIGVYLDRLPKKPILIGMELTRAVVLAPIFAFAGPLMGQDIEDRVTFGFADSDGVRIHYATLGEGPLLVMLHGFPDYWYTWRHQMDALAAAHQVVAIDMRGYNLSDKPAGVEQYDASLLVGDVAAVIRHFGRERAVIVGHDWGGLVAWLFAMHVPQMTERLIVLNLPHPRGLTRELAHNPEQQRNSQYARNFQQPDAHRHLTPEGLAGWVADPAARAKYVEAFSRSDFDAMLNYYRRNYPREPYREDTSPVVPVRAPTLVIHGLDDRFLLASALSGTWEWIDAELTIVTIPGAGHFVQHDAPETVTRTIMSWLAR